MSESVIDITERFIHAFSSSMRSGQAPRKTRIEFIE